MDLIQMGHVISIHLQVTLEPRNDRHLLVFGDFAGHVGELLDLKPSQAVDFTDQVVLYTYNNYS
jgi:hypothetical protein